MSKLVNFRLDDQDYEKLKEKADHGGLSVSAFIRNCVKKELDESKLGDELVKLLAKDPGLRATLHRLIVLGIS